MISGLKPHHVSELVSDPLLGGRDGGAQPPHERPREVHVRRNVELGDDRCRKLERGQERLAAVVEHFVALEVNVVQSRIRARDRLGSMGFGHDRAAHGHKTSSRLVRRVSTFVGFKAEKD